MVFCLMYLHFGYAEQEMNSPYWPMRLTSWLPHFGHILVDRFRRLLLLLLVQARARSCRADLRCSRDRP